MNPYKQTLQQGVTHPTIHGDYYEWLNTIQDGTFEDNFRKKYCPAFSDFHAIAMWVWSRSRETLLAKAEAARDGQ